MHVSQIDIDNFRCFGGRDANRHLSLDLNPSLNVLVGENDAGKSTIVDALRLVLWTTAQEFFRLSDDDFHVEGAARAEMFTIVVTLDGLNIAQQARFLELLTVEEGQSPKLIIHYQASRSLIGGPGGRPRYPVIVRTGRDGQGPTIEGPARELIRATYLRPLRDAEAEMTAGRGSRLSQVLRNHPDAQGQAANDYAPGGGAEPTTLVGIFKKAESQVSGNPFIQQVQHDINNDFLTNLSLGADPLSASIDVARGAELQHVLEKLELTLNPPGDIDFRVRRGLGLNNVVFMATELLLLDSALGLPLLLIEEPEAHLHPQLQTRVMELLESKAVAEGGAIQILLTTHSPNLAAHAPVENLIMVTPGAAFSLKKGATLLDDNDYLFLRRFLDVTKANLLFARGVLIVEGDAEAILLPTLADKLGLSFSKHGVSIVNVGHRGLHRYSRIFRRQDGTPGPVPVACLVDRDIPVDEARSVLNPDDDADGRRTAQDFDAGTLAAHEAALRAPTGESVQAFISPSWTFEFDMARHGQHTLINRAIFLARRQDRRLTALTAAETQTVIADADARLQELQDQAVSEDERAWRICRPVLTGGVSKAITAQFAASLMRAEEIDVAALRAALPAYLIGAIEYVTGVHQ